MSDLALQTTAPLPRRQSTLPEKNVKGRLKRALDMMIWEGAGDNEAAVIVGMNVVSIRNALTRPNVRAYYRQQCEVLRSRESAKNIHRLTQIRDAADNMPAVNAIKALEQLGAEQTHSISQQTPGITIVIQGAASAQPMKQIDANALPQSVTHDETDE